MQSAVCRLGQSGQVCVPDSLVPVFGSGRPDDLLLQVLDGGVGVGELGEQPLTGLSLGALGPLLDEDLRRLQVCLPSQQQ